MPKIKTCKTAAKRFEKTATGKIRRGNTGMNHLKLKKPKNAKRRLGMKAGLTSGSTRVVKKLVPGL